MASDSTNESEIQHRLNEFRRERLDQWATQVNAWLTAIAIFLAIFGLIAAFVGYIGFERFREIEADAKNSVEAASAYVAEAKSLAEEAKSYVEEIRRNRDRSVAMIRDINAQIVADGSSPECSVLSSKLIKPG